MNFGIYINIFSKLLNNTINAVNWETATIQNIDIEQMLQIFKHWNDSIS